MKSLLAALVLVLGLSSAASAQSPWAELGGGIPGAQGIPHLHGTGALVPGTPGAFEITGSPPFAPSMMFFSLVQVGVPFKGGLLEAYPPIVTFVINLGPAGFTMPWSSWSAVFPPGVDMYFQFAVKDASAAQGVSLTNLLRGTTQP
jgi:hypothetical protein